MFTLVSEYGNEQKIVKSERKRDELLSKGYKLIDPDPAEEETTQPPADEDPDPAEETKKTNAPKGKGKNAKTEE